MNESKDQYQYLKITGSDRYLGIEVERAHLRSAQLLKAITEQIEDYFARKSIQDHNHHQKKKRKRRKN